MFNIVREEMEWGGRKLTLETGKVARQADGAVIATYGETVVLATVVGAAAPREGVDFFPLTVNYQERYYAAGKIPGGYFKRERAPPAARLHQGQGYQALRNADRPSGSAPLNVRPARLIQIFRARSAMVADPCFCVSSGTA